MAKVLLINPPWYVLLGMSSSSVPVGLISLAGALKAAGHDVAIFNPDLFGSLYASELDLLNTNDRYIQRLEDRSDPVWRQVRERLLEFDPDVVGVHVKTPSWASGCMVACIAKEVNPRVMTVCGGPHVSCVPEDVTCAAGFDYGVLGEGEHATVRLIEAGSRDERARIPGILPSRDGSSGGASCAMIENLDVLPLDGREALMDVDSYDKLGLGALMTARGCPFPCKYCASDKIWGRKVRYRSPENVLAEIDLLVNEYGLNYFEFCDDTFTVNERRARMICDMLARRYGNLQWKCTTRCDCISSELLASMKRAGCSEVSIGVESGSPRILDWIKKNETREQIAEGCRLLREAKIPFVAFIMIGFPTETVDEAWETLHFAKALGADSLCGSIATPYPGTRMYEWAVEADKVPHEGDWHKYYHQSGSMGLWDVEPGTARAVIHEWFTQIEAYNQRPTRLTRRFLTKFKGDPVGTIRRAGSVLHRKLAN